MASLLILLCRAVDEGSTSSWICATLITPATFKTSPKKANYFTHSRLEVKPTILTRVALERNGLYVDATGTTRTYQVSTVAAEIESHKAQVRWLRLSLLHGAPAGHTSRVPAWSLGTNSICSRATTDLGSRELWSMACAFKVGSGERDGVPRHTDGVEYQGSSGGSRNGASSLSGSWTIALGTQEAELNERNGGTTRALGRRYDLWQL